MALVSEPDWAYLSVTVLGDILDKLPEPIDHLWFGAVCKQWYSVSKDCIQAKQRWNKLLPMLMIPTESIPQRSEGCTVLLKEKSITLNYRFPIVRDFVAPVLVGWPR